MVDDSESYFIFRQIVDCTVFQENTVVTVLTNLVPLFFSKVSMRFFFLTRSLIDRCQIVTDTYKNNVSKFV